MGTTKTLQQIKDELAIQEGYESWQGWKDTWRGVEFESANDLVAKLYAIECLQSVREKVTKTITKQRNNVIEAGEELGKPKDELSVIHMRYLNAIEASQNEIDNLINDLKK